MKIIKIWMTRIILSASLLMIAAAAQAATLTVTKIQDTDDGVCDVDCSLREAIDAAAAGDTIVFSSLFNTPQTITLPNLFPHWGGLTISKDLTITGPGADLLTISSDGGSGWLILSGKTVSLSDLTITGADATGIENLGHLTMDGCVVTGNADSGIVNNGSLTISNSTISENTGDLAGGILNNLSLTITNSTVSNNGAADTGSGGGGIYNAFSLTVTNSTISGNAKLGGNYNAGGIYHTSTIGLTFTAINSCTITNNSADGANSAGGVFKDGFGGGMTVGDTIIAANVNNSTKPDVAESSAAITSLGYNLIGNCPPTLFMFLGDQTGTAAAPLDPMLDPLGDYGGMTATHRLQLNSPAIDHANSFATEDQRGYLRPYDRPNTPNAVGGDGSDIGAYELQFTVNITGAVYNYSGFPVKNTRVLLRAANGEQRAVRTDRFGIYRFNNVARNRTYQVGVTHRQLEFVPQIVMVREENINNLNFTAVP